MAIIDRDKTVYEMLLGLNKFRSSLVDWIPTHIFFDIGLHTLLIIMCSHGTKGVMPNTINVGIIFPLVNYGMAILNLIWIRDINIFNIV